MRVIGSDETNAGSTRTREPWGKRSRYLRGARPVSTQKFTSRPRRRCECPRRGRGVAANVHVATRPAEYPRGSRGVAATGLHKTYPRRRRGAAARRPKHIHAAHAHAVDLLHDLAHGVERARRDLVARAVDLPLHVVGRADLVVVRRARRRARVPEARGGGGSRSSPRLRTEVPRRPGFSSPRNIHVAAAAASTRADTIPCLLLLSSPRTISARRPRRRPDSVSSEIDPRPRPRRSREPDSYVPATLPPLRVRPPRTIRLGAAASPRLRLL